MKLLLLLGVNLWFVFLISSTTVAHPGNKDSMGGHTCRTNCDDWGLNYGEYHTHQTSSEDAGSLAVPLIAGGGFIAYLIASSKKYKRIKRRHSLRCPRCSLGYLVLRYGKYGKFKACSRYPLCKYTQNVSKE